MAIPDCFPDTGWISMRLLLVFILVTSFVDSFSSECPDACFCNQQSQIIYCSRRGLYSIPEDLPKDALQLNFNFNSITNTRLQRSNFTGFTRLEHIYLSECGITSLEVETFVDLTHLKWLDLSNNIINTIEDFTFRGSHLAHMFLNGNHNIKLKANSFSGLETNGLYLHDLSLKEIGSEVLEPLNATLKKLWLNGNQLNHVSRRHLPLFSKLEHLRLGNNPLHCNCELLWLKEFYDKTGETFKGAPPPSCLTPEKLRTKYFNTISLFDFRCKAPAFNNIDALFSHNQGRLRCTASGDPAPTLYWIRPTGESKRYSPPKDEEARINEGVLNIGTSTDSPAIPGLDAVDKEEDLSGMYICLAYNEGGNVTLTLNVSWPMDKNSKTSLATSVPLWHRQRPTQPAPVDIPYPSEENAPTPRSLTPERGGSKPRQSKGNNRKTSRSHNQNQVAKDRLGYNLTALNMSDYKRRTKNSQMFTLTELIGAVIGTFVVTLLLCLICIPMYLRNQWKKQQAQLHSTIGLHKSPNPENLYLNGLTHDYYDHIPSPTKLR